MYKTHKSGDDIENNEIGWVILSNDREVFNLRKLSCYNKTWLTEFLLQCLSRLHASDYLAPAYPKHSMTL